jgi:hypothetical protein
VLSEQRIASTVPTHGEPVDWPLFLFAQEEETLDWVRYFLWEGLTFDASRPDALHQGELRSTSFRQVVEKSAGSSRSARYLPDWMPTS